MAWSDTWGKTQPTDAEDARRKADRAQRHATVLTLMGLALFAFVVASLFVHLADPKADLSTSTIPLLGIMVSNTGLAAMNYADARYYRAAYDRLSA